MEIFFFLRMGPPQAPIFFRGLFSWESLPGSGKLWNPEQVILLTVQICTSNDTFRSLEFLEILGW